ncbi:hypothetical protein ABVG11_00825 [Streptomyces sp. HD1123-B1]|uniref:hypothetical protein n=1 Tax=Streptomyces huangiella TaxID=3228804 RepID=UPI003D7CA837
MSFEREWAVLKERAAMRLNGAGNTPASGAGPDLKTNNAGKSEAVTALETRIQPDTQKAGVVADEATTAAVTGFGGWATATGLKDVQEEWGRQVKGVQTRLAGDKAALRRTKGNFLLTDRATAWGLRHQ